MSYSLQHAARVCPKARYHQVPVTYVKLQYDISDFQELPESRHLDA